MFRSVLTTAALLLLSASSYAFDGNRKGFTLGGSFGVAPVITYDRTASDGGPSAGPAMSLMAGWGVDNRNIVVLQGLSAFPMDTRSFVMNFTEIRWYSFSRPTFPSSFFTLGFGWSSLTARHDASKIDYVLGGKPNFPAATLGLGFEMRGQLLLGLYASGGRNGDKGLVNFSILLTMLGY